ncbi:MAG: RagB/SusD family nutrient uptake outer membrane protein [Balneolales bacterium]
MHSCTDLTETVKDTALGQDVLNQPNAAEQTLAPVYAGMGTMMSSHSWLNNLQSMSSYEQITPFRGGTDWFDGGRFIEMHQHTWAPSHVSVIETWGGATQGVARSAIAEKTMNDIGGSDLFKAEARGMKALYNYWLLDLWDVAFDKKPEDVGTSTLSTVFRGAAAVDYLISELDAVESQLASVGQVGETRFNRSAAIGLKARLLLNKGVYADRLAASHTHDTADLNAVIDLTTELIDSGDFQLEDDNYFNMFGLENEGHPELIFAHRQNANAGGNGSLAWFQTSRNRYRSPNTLANGSDGAAMTEEFYDLWEGERDDPRYFRRNIPDAGSVADEDFRWNRGVQIGQQYGIIRAGDGYMRDGNGDLEIHPIVDLARSGNSLIYTREVGIEGDNGHTAGARVIKWDLDPTTPSRSTSNINMGWLRLGEVYLMRAEAYARLDNWNDALDDINDLREARGARQLDANELTTLDDLEKEWYFEMYHEHWTRTIQIRFGKWENTWRDKNSTNPIRRLFPIPQDAIDAAQVQPGYLTQNPGY